ncbi:hypothetical protein BDA96_02G440700 [Sorghum bicolor]|uniref:Uncharacterized protein n=2 Tax=Sorghum bicolor TaxID=4558 RepID=A0A921UWF0_SORBI|nr:hypothetical protein BDA96_02G440700 [Sorghum bicolor]OQU88887.1 hypothetical protein SORBI_3002G115075 [Sorghum bicolor]
MSGSASASSPHQEWPQPPLLLVLLQRFYQIQDVWMCSLRLDAGGSHKLLFNCSKIQGIHLQRTLH